MIILTFYIEAFMNYIMRFTVKIASKSIIEEKNSLACLKWLQNKEDLAYAIFHLFRTIQNISNQYITVINQWRSEEGNLLVSFENVNIYNTFIQKFGY